MKSNENLCWDNPCSMGIPLCCFECEAFQECPEGCGQLGCREKMKGDEDETEDEEH